MLYLYASAVGSVRFISLSRLSAVSFPTVTANPVHALSLNVTQ